MVLTEKEKEQTLKNFMQEFFPYKEYLKIGLFTKEMKDDYQSQADRVCKFFGYDTVYEFGSKEVRAHISYVEGKRPKGEPFVTVIPSIYES